MSKAASSEFVGKWRITGMETWDAEYVDMEVAAFITIRKDLTGEFQFGLVRAEIDGRIESAGLSRQEHRHGWHSHGPVLKNLIRQADVVGLRCRVRRSKASSSSILQTSLGSRQNVCDE